MDALLFSRGEMGGGQVPQPHDLKKLDAKR